MSKILEEKVQLLLDREAIRDVVTRYSHGADRCDRSVLESVYWPDAIDDHGVYSGPVKGFIDDLLTRAGAMDNMQHLVGNILIRTDGDQARCESYFIGYHRQRDENGQALDFIAAGRYLDRLECRAGEWRILHRKVVFDWLRMLGESADLSQGLNGVQVPFGNNTPQDLGVQLFADDNISAPPFKGQRN